MFHAAPAFRVSTFWQLFVLFTVRMFGKHFYPAHAAKLEAWVEATFEPAFHQIVSCLGAGLDFTM
jgi:hypothetical protein